MRAADYLRSPGTLRYETPVRQAFTSIEVLPFLYGLPWGDLALNYLAALRPSSIQVLSVDGPTPAVACSWRVTVRLDGNRRIVKISQQVVVGAVDAANGVDLDAQLRRVREEM